MSDSETRDLQKLIGYPDRPDFDEKTAFKWLRKEARQVGFNVRKAWLCYTLLEGDRVLADDLSIDELAKAMAKRHIVGAGGEDVRLPIPSSVHERKWRR